MTDRPDYYNGIAQSRSQGIDLLQAAGTAQTPTGIAHWRGFRVLLNTAAVKASPSTGSWISTDGADTGSAINFNKADGTIYLPITHITISTVATSSPVAVEMIR